MGPMFPDYTSKNEVPSIVRKFQPPKWLYRTSQRNTRVAILVSKSSVSTRLHNIRKSDLVRLRKKPNEIISGHRQWFKEQLEMIKHPRGSFVNNFGLVLEEFRRSDIEVKEVK